MRLSGRDFDALQRASLALHECTDEGALLRTLPSILLALVPADYLYFLKFKFSPQLDRANLVGMVDPASQVSGEVAQFAQEHLFDHPSPKHFARTGIRIALMMSEFYSVQQFRRTELHQRFCHVLKAGRQLAFPADFGPLRVAGITLCNRTRDFTERDRKILNLIRPHIELAHRNARRWGRIRGRGKEGGGKFNFTSREAEIAQWLMQGKTNAEIALILGGSVRTVEKHVESILAKLGVENRTTAAAVMFARMTGPTPAGTFAKWRTVTGRSTQTGTSPSRR